MVNFCWFLFKWGLLLGVVCALVAAWYFHDTLDAEIREKVRATIAAQYPDLEVRIESARRIEGEGIVLRGLSLSQRHAEGPLAEIAYFDEIELACRTDIQHLISGNIDVQRVTIRRPTLRATRRPDGTWSTSSLLPLPKLGGTAKTTTIEQGTVILFDPVKNPSSTLTLRDVHVVIRPTESEPGTESGPSHELEGSLTGESIGHVELRGRIHSGAVRWDVSGRADELTLSPELRQSLPGNLCERLRSLDSIRGQIALSFRASSDPDRPQPIHFEAQATIKHGRIDDARLPNPLTDVNGTVRMNQNGVTVDELSARSGRTRLWLQGQQHGFGPGSPLQLQLQAQQLMLDNELAEFLPPKLKTAWNHYLPHGEVNATLALNYDGQTWKPDLNVDCVDVSFTHFKFPYRVQRGRGSVRLKNHRLNVNLRAFAGSRPVDFKAQIERPGEQGVGYLTVQTTNLPLDDRLLQSLDESTRNVVQSFEPKGSINAYVRITRNAPNTPWRKHVVLDLNRIAIRYHKFPYPIQNVQGRLEGVDHDWTFQGLTGSNDQGQIAASGRSTRSADGHRIEMTIRGAGVPMDDELRSALAPSTQKLWTRIKPQGRIGLDCQLEYRTGPKKLDLTVRIDLGTSGLIIEPDFFPYRIENLRGNVVYRNGRVDFSNITAEHQRTRIACNGHSVIQADGGWEFLFDRLAIDRLRLDRELLFAIPTRMRSGLMSLNFNGMLNLTGAARFAQVGNASAPVTSSWDVQVETLQGRMDCGILLDQINGGARLTGRFDGRQFQCRGWLDVDSALYEGFQFTEIRGPLWLADDRALFGAVADPPRAGQAPRRLTARFYGGNIEADCRIVYGAPSRFHLTAQLANGDLGRFAKEALTNQRDLRGVVAADLDLHGSSRGVHTLQGKGTIRLDKANLGELPIVLSLLKILSAKTPDTSAFNTSDVAFRIDGNHMLFDKINFNGDAISLLGKGEMDFDKNIRMVFHAVVGSGQVQIPLLRPILGLASQQLMLIYVHGTLDNPQTTREALPGVRRAVQDLQNGLEGPPANPSLMRQTQNWFDGILPGK